MTKQAKESWILVFIALLATVLFISFIVFPEAIKYHTLKTNAAMYWTKHVEYEPPQYECSNCHFYSPGLYDYCPGCGAARYGVWEREHGAWWGYDYDTWGGAIK